MSETQQERDNRVMNDGYRVTFNMLDMIARWLRVETPDHPALDSPGTLTNAVAAQRYNLTVLGDVLAKVQVQEPRVRPLNCYPGHAKEMTDDYPE